RIDYEAAVAAYEEATAPAADSEVQSALSSYKEAQVQLDELLNSPTTAEIATAEAQVADSKAALEDLLQGPSTTELREAQIALERALVSLEEAYNNLRQAKVVAPIDGTVLAVEAKIGERLSRGAVVAILADPRQLELTIDVAEIDIPRVQVGRLPRWRSMHFQAVNSTASSIGFRRPARPRPRWSTTR
ncbi:MAG: HlyD family efflux transporter periplasmic adaptor subunit, partial [Caldilineaceae bacterium]|nr:HlyD family efflux transporter periplasmic adaptor subunit [Caldilineaceae bacterium]